jgi:hypothetical protein
MNFHTQNNHIIFQNPSYISPITTFFTEYQDGLETITDVQFDKLFNINKDQLNYICHHCTSSKDLEEYGFFLDDSSYSLKSSYKMSGSESIYCILCNEEYKVSSYDCDTCGQVEIASYYNGDLKCHCCGYE